MISATSSGSGRRPYYTIGHSSRPIEAFLALLTGAHIELVADVRTLPGSRAHPQFNAEPLARSLSDAGLRYQYFPALGGLRKRNRDIQDDVNGFWENRSFHNYADYALGSEFEAAFAELRETGQAFVCAIMCAEAVWWRCHRRIIADYLIAAGETVLHILGPNKIERAELTSGAEIHPGDGITYPATGIPSA
jgi:uncharacterized protein (DUF488 family)